MEEQRHGLGAVDGGDGLAELARPVGGDEVGGATANDVGVEREVHQEREQVAFGIEGAQGLELGVDGAGLGDHLVVAASGAKLAVARGGVSVTVSESDSLVIRAANSHRERDNVVLRQYNIGDYYRAFQISNECDKGRITGTVENGLLEVRIPKREEAKPKRIEITA